MKKESKSQSKMELENEKKNEEKLMKDKEKQTGYNTIEVIVIMIVTIVFGVIIGSTVTLSFQRGKLGGMSNSLKEFVATYNSIVENYYDDVDEKALVDAGIAGMMNYLGDPYSVFMTEEESEAFNQKVNGYYIGIGTEVRFFENIFTISQVFEDSPAKKAGLEVGDVILQIDGTDVEGKKLTEVSELIKGEENTSFIMKVLRGEEEKMFTVIRSRIDLTSVTSEIYEVENHKIGYIKIDIFASNTYEQFKKELKALEKQGMDRLIIDVRDNSGGYLTTVSDILSLFLNKSKIMYQLETKGVKEPVHALTKESRSYPVAVLINHASASASEILASAMMESYGAEVIGVNSYGKGTVQKAVELSSGTSFKYTFQKWLTPNGNWINDVGVTPTIEIELNDEYYHDPIIEKDPQFQKALEVLKDK